MSEDRRPTAEEAFGKPTAEQAFGSEPTTQTYPDWLFEHGSRANILTAFGQGAAQGWGAEPLGLSEHSIASLRAGGMFNDLQGQHQSWLRTFNEAFMRPAVVGLDALWRGGAALLRGGQQAVGALGEFVAHPPPGGAIPGPLEIIPGVQRLAGEVAALPEAFPRGITELGVPQPPPPIARPVPRETTIATIRALAPPDLPEARSLGVIGASEEQWRGTEPLEVGGAEDTARAAAIQDIRRAAKEEPEGLAPPGAEQPPLDVHGLARQIDPDTFRAYDALTLRRDTYRRWLDDLAQTRQQTAETQAPHAAEIADLQDRLETATGRRAATWRNRLAPLVEQRDRWIDDFVSRDTPDMARVRQDLQAADFAMRDLAEPVSAAYREARARIPPETPEIVEPISTAAPAEERVVEAAPTPAAPLAPETPIVPPSRPPINIHDDVYQQLVAAGRPVDEANAAAALVAAHYDARAARFNGALGSAADLYDREGPRVITDPNITPNGSGFDADTKQGLLYANTLAEAQRLVQQYGGRTTRVGATGATTFDGERAMIHLLANADASTFIHETAHTWLEELLRDAAHDLAPADLRADSTSIRNWLGVGAERAIPTRAHEKFARGFERYMMEGTAPSRNLAGVFAQFKQWLASIYQTVAQLRSPITDDIRAVFDRMLALPGREPVIAPDMEIPRDFAAQHERLAEEIPPSAAHGAAERIRAEADRHATEEAPEVYDELTGRGGAEPGTVGAEGRERQPAGSRPSGYGAPPAPGRGEAAAVEPAGAERAGGVAVAPEGAGARAERTPIPATPTESFDRNPNSPFADKAGNIRLDLLTAPEDVKQAIRDTATENAEFMGARRGVISDAEVFQLADALGMDATTLDRRRIGQAFNAEEVVAARKLLIQSATGLRDAMQKAAAGTDADVMAYAAAKDRHRMIQGQVSGITAEAGRALRAFHALKGGAEAQQIAEFLEGATGRTLFQLRREAAKGAALDTTQQIGSFVRKTSEKPPGLFDWIETSWISSKLSGPATHGTYSIANHLLMLWRATAETAASAAVGAVRTAIAPAFAGEERVLAGEVMPQLYSLFYGQRQAWKLAWDAFKSNQTVPLPGEPVAAVTPFRNLQERLAPEQVTARRVAAVIEAPQRMVTALHTQTRYVAYNMSIAQQAYRTAYEEGRLGDDLARRINQLTDEPTPEMQQAAWNYGNEAALMYRSPYASFGSALTRLRNAGFALPDIPLPGGRALPLGTLRPLAFIMPFVRISSNVLDSTIVRRTPLGWFAPGIRADLSGANGGAAFDLAAGKMLAGSSFFVMAGGLAAEKIMTSSGPPEPNKARMHRMVEPPHSLKIGEMYYDVHRLGVLGMQMGIAADMWAAGYAGMSGEDGSVVAHMLTHAFTQNIIDESFMRGVSDVVRSISGDNPSYERQFAASFLPYDVGLGQLARTIDPYTRQARTVMDEIIRKLPGFSEELLPQLDIFGRPMPTHPSVVPGLTAIYMQHVNNDPVVNRMDALGMGPAMPERKLNGVQLTERQYYDYARMSGQLAKDRLDRIVSSPGFTLQPEAVQRDVITKTFSAMRAAARAYLKMDDMRASLATGQPSIVQKAIDAKKAALHQPAR